MLDECGLKVVRSNNAFTLKLFFALLISGLLISALVLWT